MYYLIDKQTKQPLDAAGEIADSPKAVAYYVTLADVSEALSRTEYAEIKETEK
mgnify:CR=1 FL=1